MEYKMKDLIYEINRISDVDITPRMIREYINLGLLKEYIDYVIIPPNKAIYTDSCVVKLIRIRILIEDYGFTPTTIVKLQEKGFMFEFDIKMNLLRMI